MTAYRSVNDTLGNIEDLHGQPVEIEGILRASNGTIDGYELLHYPSAERRAVNGEIALAHPPGLWLEFGAGSIQPNRPVLSRWVGKRVRVQGVAYRAKHLWNPGAECAMSDPSCWQAYLEVCSVQRVTSAQRKNGA